MRIFIVSLASAAAPGFFEHCETYEVQSVSATVASQMRHFPFFQDVKVNPSGLFPSNLDKLAGSLTAEIFVWTRALLNKSLISSCLDLLPN